MMQFQIFPLDDDVREPGIDGLNELRWAQIESGARVVWSTDDKPMRVLAPRSKRRIGKYNSRKAGRLLAHESRGSGYVGGEKLALMRCEIEPSVVDMRTQHLRFDLLINGKLHSYVPDIVCLMDDGSVEVVEVKKDNSWKRDEFYAEKIAVSTAISAELGMKFSVWTEADTAPTSTIKRNIVAIQTDRTVIFDEVDQMLVIRALRASDGAATFGELTTALRNHPLHIAEAILRGMMCHGVLTIALHDRINEDSMVYLYTRSRQAALERRR